MNREPLRQTEDFWDPIPVPQVEVDNRPIWRVTIQETAVHELYVRGDRDPSKTGWESGDEVVLVRGKTSSGQMIASVVIPEIDLPALNLAAAIQRMNADG